MAGKLDATGKDVLVPTASSFARRNSVVMLGLCHVQHHTVLREKGRISDEHFVQEDAQRPPIHCLPMTFVEDDFGREVLRCACAREAFNTQKPFCCCCEVLQRTAQRPRPRSGLHVLGEAEVAQLEVARFVEEEVLGFEVAVEDVVGVQVLEYEDDAGME